jgi:hypothetical protein
MKSVTLVTVLRDSNLLFRVPLVSVLEIMAMLFFFKESSNGVYFFAIYFCGIAVTLFGFFSCFDLESQVQKIHTWLQF